jgi:hypothetical protein
MTAVVVDHLCCQMETTGMGVAFYYYDYRKSDSQQAADVLAALLRCLMRKRHSHAPEVQAIFRRCKEGVLRPTDDELSHMLHYVVQDYPAVYFVIDALDEADTAVSRSVLNELLNLQRQQVSLRLMATSRWNPEIELFFQDAAQLEIRVAADDLELYLYSQLWRLSRHVEANAHLQQVVVRGIVEAADGMWVASRRILPSHLKY